MSKVVLYLGATSLKAGMAGENTPDVVTPNQSGSDVPSSACLEGLFTQLKQKPAGSSVVVAVRSNITEAAKQQLVQVMYEQLKVNQLFIAPQPTLSLYTTGHLTGLVVSAGQQDLQISPIQAGYAVPGATQVSDITDQQAEAMLQDGSLVAAIKAMLSSCSAQVTSKLTTVVLTGDNKSNLANMKDRLQKDLASILAAGVQVIVPNDPVNSGWLGGSIMAALPDMDKQWVTKQQYCDQGYQAIKDKFPV